MEKIENLLHSYKIKKIEIRKRLDEFKSVFSENDERIFSELAFCLCTPQSKAKNAWAAITSLNKNNLLLNGTSEQIKPFLNSVRFNGNKSKYIVEARNFFLQDGILKIKSRLSSLSPEQSRAWLVENVKGFGLKESSHFLRNIGFGKDLAILDRHILKNLARYGVVKEIPKSLTRKNYLEIEQKFIEFGNRIGIPMQELDLLFWSEETNFIFK